MQAGGAEGGHPVCCHLLPVSQCPCLCCAEPCPQSQLAYKGLGLLVAVGRQIPLSLQGYRVHQGAQTTPAKITTTRVSSYLPRAS